MQGANLKRFITIVYADGSHNQLSELDLPLTIGSAADADIVITGSEAIAAYIGDSQGHLFVQPAETRSLSFFHNGRHLSESSWLKSNDTMRCADSLIRYQKKGDTFLFSVSEQGAEPFQRKSLQPPSWPPPETNEHPGTAAEIPVRIGTNQRLSKTLKLVNVFLGTAFILLACAVLFVLVARPLEIAISPSPDSVTLDGFPPPLKLGGRYLCIPGSYSALIKKEGYYPLRRDVFISKSQENRLSATLEKLPGILDLRVEPEGDIAVYSDGRLLGTTPPASIEISPGTHQITLEKNRYKPFVSEIIIEGEGKRQPLEAQLEPDWAEVTITSTPADAVITVDGKEQGKTPLSLELLSGTHLITARKETYADSASEITITAGTKITHAIALDLLPGMLTITSVPSSAAVTIDTIYQGTTPLTISVPSHSDHQLVLTAPGYKPSRQQLRLAPAERSAIDLTLEQELGIIYLTTQPADAAITIDGKRYADGPGKLTLPVRKHLLEVNAPGYKTAARTILPKSGFSQQITVELLPENAAVGLHSPSAPELIVQTSSGQRLLLVEPSAFTMGAPRREPGRRANERERTVIMKRPFYLSEKVVTNQEFRQFNSSHNSGSAANHSLDGDNQPVVNISWEEAVQYLNWLSARDNLPPFYRIQGNSVTAVSPPTNGYRLPTEAEWSFAAREAGSSTAQRFPWSGTFPPRQISGNYADQSASGILARTIQGYNDTFPVTSPVASFPANNGGFYDIGGNVAEWCHDYYAASTAALSNIPDPLGPDSGTHRVIRGSSWRDAAITELRLSYRSYHREARDNVGFRIARYR